MNRRPIYMRSKGRSYWLIGIIFAVVAWFFWGYTPKVSLQHIVEKSELKGRSFTGKAKEIVSERSHIKAYFMTLKESPIVSVSFMFEGGGTAYEPEEKLGISALAASSLLFGAEDLNTEALNNELREYGIKISFGADKDVFSGKMTTPVDHLDKAVALLRKILLRPHFEKSYVSTAIESTLKAFEAEKEDPEQILSITLNKSLYGKHTYARHPLGTKETVVTLTPKDLKEFVSKKLNQANLFVGITGQIDQNQAKSLLDDTFGFLPQGNKITKISKANLGVTEKPIVLSYDSGQIIAAFAAKGTCRKCVDFYPLYIANYLLGGSGLNSVLNQQMREKEGLTYGAYSVLDNNDAANVLWLGFSATPDKFERAETLFLTEWQRVATEGFSFQQLQSAKDYLTASYNLRFASTMRIAEMLAYMQKENLGLDFLQKRNQYVTNVTLQQINEAAKKYFGKPMLSAKIGKFEEK